MLAYEEKPFMKEFEALNSHLTVSTNEERMEESKDVDPDELRVFERNRSGTSEDIWIINELISRTFKKIPPS